MAAGAWIFLSHSHQDFEEDKAAFKEYMAELMKELRRFEWRT